MISPAIHFSGNCMQAIELYKEAFNAADGFTQLYDEAPDGSGLNENGDMYGKVMHAGLTIYGTLVNFSDSDKPVQQGDMICLNVYMPDGEAVKHAYETLMKKGRAEVALGPQFFSPMYAAVVDQFGVKWQLIS